jgi:flagellar biogenesis protein FliO
MSSSGIDTLTRVVPALLLVIGAPLALLWWNRSGKGSQTRTLRITDRAGFGKNAWVAIVEVDAQRFLVGAGEQGVSLISQLEPTMELAATTESSSVGTTLVPGSVPVTNEMNEGPRNGLVRRLQLMTVRTSTRPGWSSVSGPPN